MDDSQGFVTATGNRYTRAVEAAPVRAQRHGTPHPGLPQPPALLNPLCAGPHRAMWHLCSGSAGNQARASDLPQLRKVSPTVMLLTHQSSESAARCTRHLRQEGNAAVSFEVCNPDLRVNILPWALGAYEPLVIACICCVTC